MINVYLHDRKAEARLDVVLEQQDLILSKLETIMNTTKDALAAVTAAQTRIDSLIALSAAQKKQLDAVLAGVLTPDQQADVDAIFNIGNKEASDIDAALSTNTPPATPPAA